jgi:hypothetical protein
VLRPGAGGRETKAADIAQRRPLETPDLQMGIFIDGVSSLIPAIRGYPDPDLFDHQRMRSDCSNAVGEYVEVN